MHIDQKVPVITLDGPSGTGKGTLCHLLAKHLGWHFLDSGSIYRVLAYVARQKGIDFADISALLELAKTLELDKNMTQAIRTEQCGQDASCLAAIGEIRDALLHRQREFAVMPGLVTDGRDMGTVVFPDAMLKIYLHASAEARAERRYLQLKKSGENASLAQVVDELTKRDARDMARKHAPLKPADDAVFMDTTELTIEQVFEEVLRLIAAQGHDWGSTSRF